MIKNIINQGRSPEEPEPLSSFERDVWDMFKYLGYWLLFILVFCAVIAFWDSPVHAEVVHTNSHVATQEVIDGYKVTQYVQAIYHAEGGARAKYLYGIRSIGYEDAASARHICFTTIKNNIKRFRLYGYRQYPCFVQFLASRYCPTQGRTLSASERRLNKYWVSNVRYYLRHLA